jgi:tubulin delta
MNDCQAVVYCCTLLRSSQTHPCLSLVALLPHAVLVVVVAALRSYRLASIRCVPQLPAGSVDFTTFTWTALLRRLKAMGVSGDRIASAVQQR